jgi:hypothetical protein
MKPRQPINYREGNSSWMLDSGESPFPLGLCFQVQSAAALALQSLPHRRGVTIYVVKHAEDDQGRPAEPGFGSIMGVYPTKPAAEQRRLELVDRERRHFWQHGYEVLGKTSLPPAVLGDLVLDLGLTPPPSDVEDLCQAWEEWFADNRGAMCDWQRQEFLDALDLLGRFSVIDLELRD